MRFWRVRVRAAVWLIALVLCLFTLSVQAQDEPAPVEEADGPTEGFAEMLYRELEARAAGRQAEAGEGVPERSVFGGSRRRRGKFPPRRTQSIKEEFLTPPPDEVLYSMRPNLTLLDRASARAPRLEPRERTLTLETLGNTYGAWGGQGWSILGLEGVDEIELLETPGASTEIELDPETLEPLFIRSRGGQEVRINETLARADSFAYDAAENEALFTGNVRLDNPLYRLYADRFRYDGVDPAARVAAEDQPGLKPAAHPLVPAGYIEQVRSGEAPTGRYEARNVDFIGENRSLIADFVEFDLATQRGTLIDARGHNLPLYFGAARLQRIGENDFLAEDVWLTTCDHEIPHYRLRLSRMEIRDGTAIIGEDSQLQVGRDFSFFFLPRINLSLLEEREEGIDLSAGREPDIGYFADIEYWFRVAPHLRTALRLFPTTEEGIGIGLNGRYDVMNDPTSPFFRSKGRWESMYTTTERGYFHGYHRQELTPDTLLLGQIEAWSDAEFFKDFFNDDYDKRTGPRSFVNVTHIDDDYFLSVTAAANANSFVEETQKLPEVAFSLPERHLADGLYLTYDAGAGFYHRTRQSFESARARNDVRLSYDWQPARGFNIAPFVGADARYYSDTLPDDQGGRVTGAAGATAQARFQRAYPGLRRYAGFKHIVVPSVTYLREESAGIDWEEVPQFDPFDEQQDRSRVEARLENVVLARNAENGEVWPIARMSLYHGHDFSAERAETDDYEAELTIRPRPWWGLSALYEIHRTDAAPDDPDVDFDRFAATLFYNDEVASNTINGMIGVNWVETDTEIFNRELVYGAGYRFNENWSVGFQQRYDFEREELVRQDYEVRRRLHRWEAAFRISERDSGIGFRIELNLIDFPGTRLKF